MIPDQTVQILCGVVVALLYASAVLAVGVFSLTMFIRRWGAKRLWHLPVYVLLTSRRRIWPFTDWYQRRTRLLEKAKDKPQLPLRT